MTHQTFSTVAINVVGQYNQAGKQLVNAYRAGSDRVVRNVNERFAAMLDARSLPLVTETVKSSLIDAQQVLSGFVTSSVAMGSDRAESGIDNVARGVKTGIEGLAGAGARIETALNVQALDTVSTLALPLAQVSLEIAHRVAKGSKRVSERVAGDEVIAAPVKAVAKKRVQRARRA
jgi:hypothetical protein